MILAVVRGRVLSVLTLYPLREPGQRLLIRCPRAEQIIEDQWDRVPVKGQARAPGRCRDAAGTEPGRGLGMTAGQWSTSEPLFVEDVEGSARPAAYYLAESRDGLYVPYVVRTPPTRGSSRSCSLPMATAGAGSAGCGSGFVPARTSWSACSPRVTPAGGAGTARRLTSALTGGPACGRWPSRHGGHEPRAARVRG